MKKILLSLLALISLNVAAEELVQTKASFPNYSGYITYPGSAQDIFTDLVANLDDEVDPAIQYTVDRDRRTITVNATGYDDGLTTIFKMKLSAATNRIIYSVSIKYVSEGEDVTSMFASDPEVSSTMDQYIPELLQELVDEL